ncbi:hypothetical protein [Hyphococcus sp.]|jgi:hypothetical protein|uniref:hypothetical protein n=1 Tax=Hyphococcus sp. TaxID=2038636 RepID=UPI003D0C8696
MTVTMSTLFRIMPGAGALAALVALAGCASPTGASKASLCEDGQEQVRIGPRGKGGAPLYVCRDRS